MPHLLPARARHLQSIGVLKLIVEDVELVLNWSFKFWKRSQVEYWDCGIDPIWNIEYRKLVPNVIWGYCILLHPKQKSYEHFLTISSFPAAKDNCCRLLPHDIIVMQQNWRCCRGSLGLDLHVEMLPIILGLLSHLDEMDFTPGKQNQTVIMTQRKFWLCGLGPEVTIVIMEFVQIEYRDCGLNPKYYIKIYVIDPKCNIRALHTLGTRT